MSATDIIKKFEGCKLTAYQDGGGVWTIGWGATGAGIHEGVVWTQAQADERLAQNVAAFRAQVTAMVKVTLTDGQLDALTSFAFNLGAQSLKSSGLLREVNARNWFNCVREWIKWDHDGGVEVRGLMLRRLVEAHIFLEASHH